MTVIIRQLNNEVQQKANAGAGVPDIQELQKLAEELNSSNKGHNEKSSILFNEMVRLGKDSEASN